MALIKALSGGLTASLEVRLCPFRLTDSPHRAGSVSPEQQSHSEFEALEPRTKGSEEGHMVLAQVVVLLGPHGET